MRHFFTFLVILGTSAHLFAQDKGNGKVSGTVIDAATKAPVEFATVALVEAATGKTIDGTIADGKGKFTISRIAEGNYHIVISFIGYETVTRKEVIIEGRRGDINLGTIALSEEAKQLNEVVVEGKRDLVEERVDRTIYNADQDATSRGGDASDVLRRVPNLTVDLDGNVSLRGSSNIQVLINNKPSTIIASSVADALRQIPSEEIKSVEVITAPSARYDAEGAAGIINIITKKNTLQGLTLNIDAGVGYRGSNLGLNGNYRKGKMGFSLGGFGRANYNITGSFENDQRSVSEDPAAIVSTVQRAGNRSNGLFGNYRFGWDYDIDKKNSVTASVRLGARNNNSFQDGLLSESFNSGSTLPIRSSLRDVATNNLSGNMDVNVNYIHLFDKPQRELNVLALYSRNDLTNNFSNTIFNPGTREILQRLRNENQGLNEEYSFQIDYQTPIGDNQIFEIGSKRIGRLVLSDFTYFVATGSDGEFVQDTNPTRNNQLNYRQDITAGYTAYTYSDKRSGLSFKGGLRYEYTTIKAFSRVESNIEIPDYGVLVPSFNTSKRLKNGTIKASYNRRIQRPSIRFLNPNRQDQNPLNVTIGNPLLDPEFTNNYELGYSTFIKGVNLSLTGFVRNSNNSIQSIRGFENDTVLVTRFGNIGRESAYGSSVFANVSRGRLTLGGGGDVFYADLSNNVPDPSQNASNSGWVYSGRVFGSLDLGNGWAMQTFSFYRGRSVQLQGFQGGFGTYSLGARKEFKNKRGSVGMALENFLAPNMKIRNGLNTPTIDQRGLTVLENFSVRLNFSYRLGKMSFDQPQRRRGGRSINNDDLKEGDFGSNMDTGQGREGFGGGGRMGGFGGGGRPATTTASTTADSTQAADPDAEVVVEGTWAYKLESPQGVSEGKMVLEKTETGYKGTITSARMGNRATALESIVVKGNELTFQYTVSFGGNSSTIQVKGIIKDKDFSGNMAFGQFGSFPMTATRE